MIVGVGIGYPEPHRNLVEKRLFGRQKRQAPMILAYKKHDLIDAGNKLGAWDQGGAAPAVARIFHNGAGPLIAPVHLAPLCSTT